MTDPSRDPAELSFTTVDPQDLRALGEWLGTTMTVFHRGVPATPSIRLRQRPFAEHRLTAARDAARTVATFRSFATTLTLPGAESVQDLARVRAITNVAVLPTHRRRGVLRQLMTDELAHAQDEGAMASVLIASEAPIYGRFGFGPATSACTWTVDATRAVFRDAPTGSMALVDAQSFVAMAPQIYHAARLRHPGSMGRDLAWWQMLAQIDPDPDGEDPLRRLAVHRAADGTPDGFVIYRVDHDEYNRVNAAVLTVADLFASNDAAYADLWRYCCEMDFVTTVVAPNRSPQELLPWLLTDPRTAQNGPASDLLWLRLHDVPAALSARRYAASGHLVLQVRGDGGRIDHYELNVGSDGRGTCTTALGNPSPDLSLSAQAMASLWLGGHSPTTLARAGQLRSADPGTLVNASAMFCWPDPAWCGTWF